MRFLSLLALSLVAFSTARAEVIDGVFQVNVPGQTAVVDIGGVDSNRAHWEWSGTPFPASDFRLVPDANASVNAAGSDVYDSADFPASATHTLPSSIGSGDRMYRLSVCDTSSCDNAGFLWVINGGAELRWFLRSDWAADRIDVGTGEWVQFEHLTSAPSTTQTFRYLAHDRY